jgi:hypothetical protein
MADPTSKKVIYAALAGNGLIAVTKFGATLSTGSSAMLSVACGGPSGRRTVPIPSVTAWSSISGPSWWPS